LPSSGLLETAAVDEVRTTRFTVPAFTQERMTLRVPWTPSSISSVCTPYVVRINMEY
jgi:hypothetical protein